MKAGFVKSFFTVAAFLAALAAAHGAAAQDVADASGAAVEGVALTMSGKFVQGGIIRGRTEPGAAVTLGGRALPVSESGDFVFGFGRDHDKDWELTVKTKDGRQLNRVMRAARRDYEIQRIDGLPERYVTPRSPETIKRIQRELALKNAARKDDTPQTFFTEQFVWPAIGRISGVYGSQRVLNGKPSRPHFGVDVAAPTGTPVYAPAGGTITLAEPDMYFEGGLIYIDHGHGLISVLMHLSSVDVKAGDTVKQGDPIGKIGASGRATGAHLDWRMYWTTERVDPSLLVGPNPGNKG